MFAFPSGVSLNLFAFLSGVSFLLRFGGGWVDVKICLLLLRVCR